VVTTAAWNAKIVTFRLLRVTVERAISFGDYSDPQHDLVNINGYKEGQFADDEGWSATV